MAIKDMWSEKYRPKKLEDLILPNNCKEYFNKVKLDKELPNHIFLWGNPGGGKSSGSKLIPNELLDCQYLYINASDENGIDTIRNKITNFIQTKSIDGKVKIVICDEADGISFQGQQALRNIMEEYADNCRFILTGNYKNKIMDAIQSRCISFELNPPYEDVIKRCAYILIKENIEIPEDQKVNFKNLVKFFYPDIRSIINNLQKFSINNKLNIPSNLNDINFSTLIDKIINSLILKEDIFELRKMIIQNEMEFNSNYYNLMKCLFEKFINIDVDVDIKKKILIIIGEFMYRDNTVLDKEINFYCCLLKINGII